VVFGYYVDKYFKHFPSCAFFFPVFSTSFWFSWVHYFVFSV
jgi:hypothetical protein